MTREFGGKVDGCCFGKVWINSGCRCRRRLLTPIHKRDACAIGFGEPSYNHFIRAPLSVIASLRFSSRNGLFFVLRELRRVCVTA